MPYFDIFYDACYAVCCELPFRMAILGVQGIDGCTSFPDNNQKVAESSEIYSVGSLSFYKCSKYSWWGYLFENIGIRV